MVARGAPTTIGKSLCAQERNLHTACPCNQKQNEVKMERSGGKPKGSQWHLNSSKRITAGASICIGAVQNKLFVDLLRDESQNPLCNQGMNAWKVRAKMILQSVGIGTHAYKHGGVRGGGARGVGRSGARGARVARVARASTRREHAPRRRRAAAAAFLLL